MSLRVLEKKKHQPCRELVDELRFLLDAAEAGELVAIVYAAHNHEDAIRTGILGMVNRVEMLGSMALMSHKLSVKIEDE